jgi:hypothetical protein
MFTFLNRILFTENPSVFGQIPSENPADCEVQIRKIVNSLLGTEFTKSHRDIVINYLFRNMKEKGAADLCLDLLKNKYDCERFIWAVAEIQNVQRIQNKAEKLQQATMAKKAYDEAAAIARDLEHIAQQAQAAAEADEATAVVALSPLEELLHISLPMPFCFSICLVLFLLVGFLYI